MSIANRVTLRYANALIESDYSRKHEGSVEFTFKVKLGDLTSKIPALKNEIHYSDEELNDDNVDEAFSDHYLGDLETKIWTKIKHLDGISNFTIEDIDGIPRKMADLKSVTLEFRTIVYFELPYNLMSELEKNVGEYLKSQFY